MEKLISAQTLATESTLAPLRELPTEERARYAERANALVSAFLDPTEYTAPNEVLRLAAVLTAEQLYLTRDTNPLLQSEHLGDYSYTRVDAAEALPQAAIRLLEPYSGRLGGFDVNIQKI